VISFISLYKSLIINCDELNSLHISSNRLSNSTHFRQQNHYCLLDYNLFVESYVLATHNRMPSSIHFASQSLCFPVTLLPTDHTSNYC
jgi:hypothetical protein